MKADYSRFRFNLNKGYSRVLQQQGRVTLDADWNEQVSIQADLDRKRLQDVVGHSGVPYGDPGFLVSIDDAGSALNLDLSAGTIYVAGHRIHLDDSGKYNPQPFLPDPPAISDPGESNRVDLVYLCVRERHVTYLEDETIREVALGGPDTTTRVQSIWQVSVKEGVSLADCEEDADAIMAEAGVGAGALTTIEDSTVSADDNPCVTPADSGYRGLENRLYRVEVHAGGTVAGGAGVKWSRYNGAVAFNVLEINVSNRILTLARLGWDQVVTLTPNSWIELVSEADELAGRPGAMLQISADAGAVNDVQRQVTLKNVADITTILNGYAAANNVKVRLWDSEAVTLNADFDASTNTTEIILGDGIGIKIGVDSAGDIFRSGDYWTFTARTMTGRVEELIESPPQGPEWHCCKLALIHWNPEEGVSVEIEDCRPLFPALTEMLQLYYVGGDGQEGKPGDTLPGELIVRVSRGEHPVENVPVVFAIRTQGDEGKVISSDDPTGADTITVDTGSDGLASCEWQLGSDRGVYHQRVVAWIDAPADARVHQQVTFNANLSIAEEVSYIPPAPCVNIDNTVTTVAEALNALCNIEAIGVTYTPPAPCTNLPSVNNVAEALNALCNIDADGVTYTPPANCPNLVGATNVTEALNILCNITSTPEDDPGFHVVRILWLVDEKEALHDESVEIKRFIGGLLIVCDDKPDPSTIKQASVFVTIELPSQELPGVQLSYILEGDLEVSNEVIKWLPTAQAKQFLLQDIGKVVGSGGVFLARLFLKGSKIWLQGKPEVHLDGDVVNLPGADHNLDLPSGDGEKGGTFEMWFNLEVKVEGIHVIGVLHPKGLMGFATTSIKDKMIIIDSPYAVNLRMDALDLGYVHREAMNSAGFSSYQVSGTLFNETQARAALFESGFGQIGDFRAIVLLQEKYQELAPFLDELWGATFGPIKLSFSFKAIPADQISDTIREGLDGDEMPSIVICDDTVFGDIRSELGAVEPYGLVRRPYFRRI